MQMDEVRVLAGKGRTEVTLHARILGSDLVVLICNVNAHIGAVAVGEYDGENGRTSVSVHTRLGHKDDVVAQKAAYSVCKSTRRPVCVIAGIHVDNITAAEIEQVMANADTAVQTLIARLGGGDESAI